MTQQLTPGSFTAPHPADSCHSSQESPAAPEPFPPLSLLAHETNAVPALLLLSFAGTHRAAFDYLGFTVAIGDGRETVTGDFVQRHTGRRYIVTVTPEPRS